MEKRSTVLLTVIAVATLLVAVIGATFAYFASSYDTADKDVTIKATTSYGVDSLVTNVSDGFELSITNDNMMPHNNDNPVVADSDTATVTLSLTAGSGVATCTYKLSYEPTAATGVGISPVINTYTKTTGANLEYTIQGSAEVTGSADTVANIAETNIDEAGVLGTYTITNTATAALTPTVHTWTFTNTFYNLKIDQEAQLNKHFEGKIVLSDVSCSNDSSGE